MNLSDYTRPQLFHPALKAADANGAIRELAAAMASEQVVPNGDVFCDAVLRRERLSNTDIEAGWAMPHARVQGLAEPSFAVGRFSSPVRWAVRPVTLVILLAAPDPDVQGLYLKLISSLARLARQTDLVEPLLRAADGFQMFEAMREISAPISNTIK